MVAREEEEGEQRQKDLKQAGQEGMVALSLSFQPRRPSFPPLTPRIEPSGRVAHMFSGEYHAADQDAAVCCYPL